MSHMGAMLRGRAGASRRRTIGIATAACAALALAAGAAPAMASLKQDLARFSDCPLSNPTVGQCAYSTTTSGEFVLGSSVVPINKTITIQGGLTPPTLVAAADGNTLSKTALSVPGGLLGIELPGNFTEVTATAELAGTGQIASQVVLPLKVKLDNLLLGGGCYIGSSSEPVALALTYGTTNPPPPNKPISGNAVLTTKDNGAILSIAGTLVDNSFSAPGASGCTILPLIGDLAVDVKEGLPAAAGKNTAIMSGTTEEVSAQIVRQMAPLPEFGRCAKAEAVTEGKKAVYHGLYLTSACTAESGERTGKYEWTAGPGAKRRFTGANAKLTLETLSGSQVVCSAGTNEGEYTGPKTETVALKLTGCAMGPKGAGASCQSSSAAAGEIQTAALQGNLDYIKENEEPATPVIGIDLKAKSGANLAVFECGGTTVSVSGSVIVPVTAIDKMVTAFKLKALAPAGHQSPEAFETGPSDTLTSTRSGGGPEQAGLTVSATSTGEEPLEIKAAL